MDPRPKIGDPFYAECVFLKTSQLRTLVLSLRQKNGETKNVLLKDVYKEQLEITEPESNENT